ncbi:hypothetical protein QFC21_000500 [Naganishia friedmannii]|uniref:Uncharacterized protein n=1 Tax=Naganishia friedmannii TaxID=89922 RepID=A0ACC2WDP3_9TREE|nr:hypothetical protein QFC21_000500 [Naganishia friedmannii]
MPLLDKLKAKLDSTRGGSSSNSADYATCTLPLGPESVIRYRQQRGVNLGAWFVNERWLATDPYTNVPNLPPNAFAGASDHDIAIAPEAKARLEQHWDSWITDQDWKWLVERGFNSVRLPIGYYHLVSAIPEVVNGTDFENVAGVFEGAWSRIQKAIDVAGRYGLGVLLDFHCAAAHCGVSTGKVDFWNRKANFESTALALNFLAHQYANVPHVIGLELLNEPANDCHNGKLPRWYQDTINNIRQSVPADFPLYIHDAFDPWTYAPLVGKQGSFVALDHHLYRCFTKEDGMKSGQEHAQNLGIDMAALSGTCNGSIVIGEWSAALHAEHRRENAQDDQRRAFCRAELDMFERFTAGWFFWTYKVHRWLYDQNRHEDWDSGWSARSACEADVMPQWVGFKVKNQQIQGDGDKGGRLQAAYDTHVDYWNQHKPGKNMEHDRFQAGLKQGWEDAVMFLNTQGPSGSGQRSTSRMGFIHEWCKRRSQEHVASRGGGEYLWEYEHGLKQGVQLANDAWLI